MLILLPVLAFILGSLLVAGAAMALRPGATASVEQRLAEVTGTSTKEAFGESAYHKSVIETLKDRKSTRLNSSHT